MKGIDLLGTLRRLSTAVVAPVAALIASLGNQTADMDDVVQADDGDLAAYLKELRSHTRGHNQTRICLIVPDLANIASDDPNTVIRTQLELISTVSLLDQTGVDGGVEGWDFFDLIVVGSNTYAGFTNANLDDLILTKIPIMVCNSAVAEHLKMGTATTQSANTVNEWCKTIGNRIMYLVFGSTGDKALFDAGTLSDRLDMSDASLHEHLLMTSLTGDTNTTAVVAGLPMESGTGVLYTLDDDTEMPAARLFAGCFVNADNLTDLGTLLLRRMTRNFIQASVTPSITLKANASLLAKIHQDTNELETDWTNGGRLDNLLDAITPVGPTNAQMNTARDAIIAEIDTNETKIDDLDGDLVTHESSQSTHRTALTNHESSQNTHRAVLVDIHGTDLPAVKSVADAIAVLVDTRVAGRMQIEVYPLDLDSASVGSYATLTATDGDIIIESLIFSCTRDLSGDSGFTGLSVETDDATPQVFISQADGVKANLTAESQIAYTGSILLREGQYLYYSVYGGSVASVTSLCEIVIKFRAVVSGGYLA